MLPVNIEEEKNNKTQRTYFGHIRNIILYNEKGSWSTNGKREYRLIVLVFILSATFLSTASRLSKMKTTSSPNLHHQFNISGLNNTKLVR